MGARFFIILVALGSALSGCIICNNLSDWRGKKYPGNSEFNNDSTILYVTLVSNSKQISMPGVLFFEKKDGYLLRFLVEDRRNYYQKVDSIAFALYSYNRKQILQESFTNCSNFPTPYAQGYAYVEVERIYPLDTLKGVECNLFIDFTVYLQTKKMQHREIRYHNYELEYSKCRGIHWWTY